MPRPWNFRQEISKQGAKAVVTRLQAQPGPTLRVRAIFFEGNMKIKRGLAIVLALGFSLAALGHADNTVSDSTTSGDAPAASAQSAGLGQRVADLEHRLAALDSAAALQGAGAQFVTHPAGGIGFSNSDGTYGIQFGGTLQEDSRNYIYDGLNSYNNGKDYASVQPNEFVLARARLLIDGILGPRLHVRYQEDFSNNGNNSGVLGSSGSTSGGNGAILVDAYGELKLFPWTLLRVGQFKAPLDIERGRPTPALDFIQYSYTGGLVVDRAQGAALEISDPKQIFYFSAGAYDGDTDAGSTPVVQAYNGDKDAIGKIFIQPFQAIDGQALGDFGFGVSGSGGNHTWDPEAGFKSLGQLAVTNPAVGKVWASYTEGEGYRLIPQAYWFWKNLSLLGEYVHESDGFRFTPGQATVGGHNASNANDTVESEAWSAQASWVVTGERTAYSGVKLNKDSFSWGALQLVARAQGANYDEGAFTTYNAKGVELSQGLLDPLYSVKSLESWSVGVNYIPVSDLEFLVDWDQTVFTDGGGASIITAGKVTGESVANRPTEQVLQARAQFAF